MKTRINTNQDIMEAKLSYRIMGILYSHIIRAIFAILFALGPQLCWGAFEDLGAGARAPGMGNAFTAVADDVYTIYYNPAGLSDLKNPEFSASYSKLYPGLSDDSNLGISQIVHARPLKEGRWGTMGIGWQRFSLNQLYSENSFTLSYGRQAMKLQNTQSLQWGLNLKYLNHAFNPTGEASNAKTTGFNYVFNGQPDPVLSGKNSKGVIDGDLGLLWRTHRHYSLGLMATHLTSPNISFAGDQDKLPLGMKLGFGYKSLWSNLASDIDLRKAPDGSMDKILVLGAERYFPSLDYGQIGFRGSLGIGSRDFRQITMGFSYRINKIQLDYAFLMPLGTIRGTLGNHRIAFLFHFGAPSALDEFSHELMDNLQKINRTKDMAYAYEFEGLKRLSDSDKVVGTLIRNNIEQGSYEKAHRYLNELVEVQDNQFSSLKSRLKLVSEYFPQLTSPKLKWEKFLVLGIYDFLNFGDAMAIKRIAYAYSMNVDNPSLEKLLRALETNTKLTAERVSSRWLGKFSLLEEKILKTEEGLQEGRADDVIKLGQEILDLEPENATALSRMGTAYYLKGNKVEAMTHWIQATKYEENAQERKTLYRAIRRARLELKRQTLDKVPASKPLKPVAAPTQQSTQTQKEDIDPREIENLYQEALQKYARGQKNQAAALFEEILSLDPNNAQAKKALDRIRGEQP